jgi:hypothetical protein
VGAALKPLLYAGVGYRCDVSATERHRILDAFQTLRERLRAIQADRDELSNTLNLSPHLARVRRETAKRCWDIADHLRDKACKDAEYDHAMIAREIMDTIAREFLSPEKA